MPSATELFTIIGQAITGFMTNLGNAFSSVTQLFWTAGEGSSAGSPTFLGLLTLLGIGVGLCYLAFRLIKGAVQRLRG